MEYRIKFRSGAWVVYEGRIVYGDFFVEKTIFSSPNISDCYAFIKAMQEGLIIE